MYASLMMELLGFNVGPAESVQAARWNGFEGVDLQIAKVLDAYGKDRVKELRDDMFSSGVRPGYCTVTAGRVSVPEPEWKKSVDRLPDLCKAAAELGYTRAGIVVLPGDNDLDHARNEQLHVNRVREAMGVLGDYGIALGLEYVSPLTRQAGFKHRFVHEIEGMLELIANIDRKGVGLMLDSFHWHCAGEGKEEITALKPEQIVVVHVCDAIKGRPVEQQVVNEREMPGESGVIDLHTFFTALRVIEYEGPITCEPLNAKWTQLGVEETVMRAARGIRKFVS